MELSDFTLQRLVFEVRFDEPALRLWDRAGQLWSEAKAKMPDLNMQRAEPNATRFRVRDKWDISVHLERFNVVRALPGRSIDEFARVCEDFNDTVERVLQIGKYKRLGLRSIYWRRLKDKAAVAAEIRRVSLLNLPQGKFFGVSPDLVTPEYSIRYQDDVNGALVQIRAEDGNLNVDLPIEALDGDLKSIEQKSFHMTLDVDYYTHAEVEVGQYRPRSWIENAAQVVRRDVRHFIGGK
jgi:hypothetical protein